MTAPLLAANAPDERTWSSSIEPDTLESAFDEAARATGQIVERRLEVAGHRVHLRFAGPTLVETVFSALAHREQPGSDAAASASTDLTVEIWDGASTGVLPPVSVRVENDEPDGARYVYDGPRATAVYQPGYETFSVITRDFTRAWLWAGSLDTVPYWDIAAPLRLVLHWWSMGLGMHLVHGGAVTTDTGAALVVGNSGSGKSTATLACLADGLRYGGDDHVVIDPGDPPLVHPLYSSGKLAPHHLARFPDLLPTAALEGVPPGEKAVAFLDRSRPGMMAPSLPLAAVLMPRVVNDGPTRLVPTSKAAALAALAPSTIFQMPGTRQRELTAMADIVARTPAYVLELGPDLAGIGRMVEAVIEP